MLGWFIYHWNVGTWIVCSSQGWINPGDFLLPRTMNMGGLQCICGKRIHNLCISDISRLHTCRDHRQNVWKSCLGVVFCAEDEACHIINKALLSSQISSFPCHQLITSFVWILPRVNVYISRRIQSFKDFIRSHPRSQQRKLVLATGPGNPPAVRVWTGKTVRFSSKTLQKPNQQTLGGPNPDAYLSTRGFRRVSLDPSVPISGSAFRVSHLWSHSDMRLLIVKYWPWYVKVRFRRISRLDVQNKHTQAPNYNLKMSVNRASMIFGLASSVIWMVRDHRHPYRRIWQPL